MGVTSRWKDVRASWLAATGIILLMGIAACGQDDPAPNDSSTDAAAGCMVADAADDRSNALSDGAAESAEDCATIQDDAADQGAPDQAADGCVPGCHWDCFGGGAICEDGEIWVYGYGPRPCCGNEPWPEPGPVCTTGPHHSCPSGLCNPEPDPRYVGCFGTDMLFEYSGMGYPNPPKHIYELMCADAAFRMPGDACIGDADCRPAAGDPAPRLVCDLSTSTCAEQPRPSSDVVGGDCGLGNSYVSAYAETAHGSKCNTCHVYDDGICRRQACTVSCYFDEDCPEGMVCLCAMNELYSVVGQFCAAATDRATREGRAAGLPQCSP